MSVPIPKPTKKVGTNVKRAASFGGKKKVKKKAIPKIKKPKKPSRKSLVKDLDAICSKITKVRWGGKCAVCGTAGISAHHFFGKKSCSGLRWIPDNLIWLCFYCHIIKNHRQGLTEPVRKAMTRKIGLKRFDELYSIAFIPKKFSVDDLIALKEELSSQLENLSQLSS
jgi:5-methylcytosine-specific restriction endonuclease McrA